MTASGSVEKPEPLLSFVLCSRNDGYGGNSLWRLQTALNHLGLQLEKLAGDQSPEHARVEVVLCDWGSPEVPLAEALQLGPGAAAVTRIVEVPEPVARQRQQDSPFAEVVANNVAIRRARGLYVGRIDQDTLVGLHFLEHFLARAQREEESGAPPCLDFAFMGRRHIPLAFARRSFGMPTVVRFLDAYSHVLPSEGVHQQPWFDAPVGVVVMHRELWTACRGYDERLLNWGFMETDLGYRVMMQGRTVDLEAQLRRDFYHLAHAPHTLAVTTRRKNPRRYPSEFAPNDSSWGMADEQLVIHRPRPDPLALTEREGDPAGVTRFAPHVAAECGWEASLSLSRWLRAWVVGERIEGVLPIMEDAKEPWVPESGEGSS